jgi:hypothetical protein
MKLMDLSEKSTPLSSSGKAFNPNGRMWRIKMEEGSFFRCRNHSPTKNKSMKLSHSNWLVRPFKEAKKWMVFALSLQKIPNPTVIESKFGPISMNQIQSQLPISKTFSSNWSKILTSKWKESISVKWRAKVLLSNPREKENDSWNDYICKYCNLNHLLNITSMD